LNTACTITRKARTDFLRGIAASAGGEVGGTIMGGGVEVSMAGRKIYDTGEGTNVRGGLDKVRAVAQQVFDAADAAQNSGHAVKSNVLEGLKSSPADLQVKW
jgi:hypothetical protein